MANGEGAKKGFMCGKKACGCWTFNETLRGKKNTERNKAEEVGARNAIRE